MGKGDKRTKRGKIARGTNGVRRPKKKLNDRLSYNRQSEAIPQIFNLQSSIFNSGLSGLGRLKPD